MRATRQITAIFITTFSAVGLIFILYAGIRGVFIRQQFNEQFSSSVDLIANLTASAQESVALLNDTIDTTEDSIETLEQSTVITSQSIGATGEMANSFSDLFSEELPAAIINTQTSITSAQNTARVIDNLLRGFSVIPFVTLEYDPDVPLADALGDINTSLDEMPDTFESIGISMGVTGENMTLLNSQLDAMTKNLSDIQINLQEAQAILNDTNEDLVEVRKKTADIQTDLPKILRSITWGGLIFFLSSISILLNTFLQGLNMINNKPKTEAKQQNKSDP